MDRDNLIDNKENNKIKKFISFFSVLVLFIGVFLVANNAGDTYAYTDSDCPDDWTYVKGGSEQYAKCQRDFIIGEAIDERDPVTEALEYCKGQLSRYVTYDESDEEGRNFCYRTSSTSDIIKGTFYLEDYAGACYVCPSEFNAVYNSESSLGSCSTEWEKKDGVSKSRCKFYTVSYYDENDGTPKALKENLYFYNTKISLYEKSKDGYTFDGWVYGQSGECSSGDLVSSSLTVTSNRDITLCYSKAATEKKYTANFNANGGTGATEKNCSTTGTSCSVTPPSVSRSGYTHVGWSKSSNSTSCSYNVTADSTTPTYYACWSKNDYKVTFNMNGGILKRNDVITNKIVYKLGTIDTSSYVAERNNDTFNGWSTSSDCSSPNKSYTNSNITKAMSLYACFTEVEDPKDEEEGTDTPTEVKYDVKFDTLGGKLLVKGVESAESTFKLSSLYYKDYVAEKGGYTFKGWSLSKTCDKIGSSEKYYDPLRENMDLYACYNANITISKQDITTEEELPGATLVLKDSTGKVIKEWVSSDKPYEIKDLPVGKYILTETIVPSGYGKTSESIEFEVLVDNSTKKNEIVMYNIPENVVSISKQDITTKQELPGATLVLKDSNGKEIDKWVSTNEPHVIKGLKAGKYTLEETIAPKGYELNTEKVTFEIKDNGKVEPVVMYNKPETVVSISKQDVTTKKELPGATLVLKDSTGKEIDKWESSDKPHVIKGLKAGKYTLEETIAPKGYELNKEKITFEVENDGKVKTVVMENALEEIKESPQTGSILLYIVYLIGAISLGYACYYYVMNVKKND